jgi:hypothetical protein
MRFLGLIVILAAAVFAVGLYQGWFRMSPQSAEGKSKFTLTMDKDKMGQDKQKAQNKMHDPDMTSAHPVSEAASNTPAGVRSEE